MKALINMETTGIKRIVFLGASTAFHEVSEIIDAVNRVKPSFEIVTILDDNSSLHGQVMRGVKVTGFLSEVEKYADCDFVFGIGSMNTRLLRHKIFSKLNVKAERFPAIIHPRAVIDHTAKVGFGCIIHPGVVIGNDAELENFVIVAVNSAVGPYAKIKQYAMITSLSLVLSSVTIGQSAFIGSCSCVTEGVHVGDGAMIGVGTIVTRNLDNGVFVLGNPMRQISKVEINL